MQNSGFEIITYIDVNPQSPTYGQTRTERVANPTDCATGSSSWSLVTSYCEMDSIGANSGYRIDLYEDIDPLSPTFAQTREDRTRDLTTCPLASTNPNWMIDDEYPSYCETKFYEPSHTEGNTGLKVVQLIDENMLSPTYGHTQISAVTSSDCVAPDTTPHLEDILENCQLCTAGGTVQFNGIKEVVGIDKNVYSSTFLSTVTQEIEDVVKCPDGGVYNFSVSNASPQVTYQNGSTLVTVTSNRSNPCRSRAVSWVASESCDWVDISTTSNALSMTYSTNPSYDSRTCSITLTQAESNNTTTVALIQDGKPPHWEITMPVTSVSWDYSAHSATFVVNSVKNDTILIPFTASESCNWVTVTTSSTSMTVSVTENDSPERRCVITVTQDESGKFVQFLVEQGMNPEACTIYSITANPTKAQLVNGTATTQVTVSSSGSVCSNDWEAYKMILINGQWQISPTTRETGHSGSNYSMTQSGRYRIFSIDDSSHRVDVTAVTPYSLTVSGTSVTPNVWSIDSVTSNTTAITSTSSPSSFGLSCTATTADQGNMSRTCYYALNGVTISGISWYQMSNGTTTCSGDSTSISTWTSTIQCGTSCFVTFSSNSVLIENKTNDRWQIDVTLLLSGGGSIDFRGVLYGTAM